MDRYDDREIVKTNLIESYDQLLQFGKKHLPDKFFLEDTINKSLRNTIVREMVSNTLMHREFSRSYTAKFVIEKDRMYAENANRATGDGYITVDNLEPNPKNPIIAAFFRNIGYADQLGSGVRNLFKYSKLYSGKNPQLVEGDVFRIIVPLDDEYSFDFRSMKVESGIRGNSLLNETQNADKSVTDVTKSATDATKSAIELGLTEDEKKILSMIKHNPRITQKKLHEATGISLGTIKRILPRLQEKGVITRNGSRRSGQWKIQNFIL